MNKGLIIPKVIFTLVISYYLKHKMILRVKIIVMTKESPIWNFRNSIVLYYYPLSPLVTKTLYKIEKGF